MQILIFVINSKNNATLKYKQFLTLNVRFFSLEILITFRVQFNVKQSSNPKQVTEIRNIYAAYIKSVAPLIKGLLFYFRTDTNYFEIEIVDKGSRTPAISIGLAGKHIG